MKLIDLNGPCEMYSADRGEKLAAQIPGSVAAALLQNGKIPDPYYRDNEEKVLPVFEKDYIFRKMFHVSENDLSHDTIYLVCQGLDTICDIKLNDRQLGATRNMFVEYRFEVKDQLRPGENVLEFYFHSPVKYLREHQLNLGKPFNVLRKAGCMFGWDWGINLPDSGVWKPCFLEAFTEGRILQTQIRQKHGEEEVILETEVRSELWESAEKDRNEKKQMVVQLYDSRGRLLYEQTKQAERKTAFCIRVTDPQLWWPRGYGDQPLYVIRVSLKQGEQILDVSKKKIGLRTVELNRQKDGSGHKYEFVVNRCPVYIKGESLVIQDALISRSTEEKWRNLIRNCVRSNLNCIRVWGGAYYPPEVFYELCDREGILVFQDFMFACTFYYPSKEFTENVSTEVRQQVIRLRDHPCICVFCGNNELDCIYTAMTSTEPQTVELRRLFGAKEAFDLKTRFLVKYIYGKLFLKLIPDICREYAPQIPYTHSSPAGYRPLRAKSFLEYLDDGDMHYYLQYNGNAPFQKMRELNCRFMSELGFQSYPSYKTICSFTEPEDRGPYTDVMYAHQKCQNGNETIEEYLRREYIVPENFEEYVYLSQIQAGEIMSYSVEHMRRHSDYNRGIIIWQLNDCWPVCSWSGIDYYGRWKAQQYYTKRFFEPVLVSAEDNGMHVDIYVVCDGERSYDGEIRWSLETDQEVLLTGRQKVHVGANSAERCVILDFSEFENRRTEICLRYGLEGEKNDIHTLIFCPHREFHYKPADIRIEVTETEEDYTVDLYSEKLVLGLMLDLRDGDAIFSDNFFALKGHRRITTEKIGCTVRNLKEFKEKLFIKSLNQVMERTNEVSDKNNP